MATYDRFQSPIPPFNTEVRGPYVFLATYPGRFQSPVFAPTTVTYVMRGEDKNVNGLYDTWISVGSADFAAALYAGSLATPLRDVVVQSKA